jgi:hypothetical protein
MTLRVFLFAHPTLTGWANLWRASGAGSARRWRVFARHHDTSEDVTAECEEVPDKRDNRKNDVSERRCAVIRARGRNGG